VQIAEHDYETNCRRQHRHATCPCTKWPAHESEKRETKQQKVERRDRGHAALAHCAKHGGIRHQQLLDPKAHSTEELEQLSSCDDRDAGQQSIGNHPWKVLRALQDHEYSKDGESERGARSHRDVIPADAGQRLDSRHPAMSVSAPSTVVDRAQAKLTRR
jgi:hypothetical protein